MKVYPNGLIIFDAIDIVCLGFIMGFSTTKIIKILKKYYSSRNEDRLITDLKRRSRLKKSSKYEPLDSSVRYFPRGGQVLPPGLKMIVILIKNRQFGKLIVYLLRVTKRIRQLKRVKAALICLNVLFFKKLGFAFAAGGSITHLEVFIFVTTSSTAGSLLALLTAPSGYLFVLVPILTLIGRYEFIPAETLDRCRLLYEAAREYHNKELGIEMGKFSKAMETKSDFNSEQGPFECTSERTLYKRHLKNQEYRNNRVGNFEKIRKRFLECNNETEDQIKQKVQKMTEKIRVEP